MAQYIRQSVGHDGLDRARHQNDQKLKARFEHIFRKYEHDFTGIGDEIDIESGDLVVNNGHLEYMRHEVDPGKSASSLFVKSFQEKLEDEDEDGETSWETENSLEEDGEIKNLDIHTPAMQSSLCSSRDLTPTQNTDGCHPVAALGGMARPAPRLAHLLVDRGTAQLPYEVNEQHLEERRTPAERVFRTATPSSSLLSTTLVQLPGIEESINSLRSNAERATVGSDILQALGTSIANQLARLMTAPSQRENDSTESQANSPRAITSQSWNFPRMSQSPQRKRERSLSFRMLQPPASPDRSSPGLDSIWAVKGPGRRRKRQRLDRDGERPDSTPIVTAIRSSSPVPSSSRAGLKRCWNCSLTSTPKWQVGPHGQDLCVSCGAYLKCHGRMKPFDSPTPSIDEAIISDSHVQTHQSPSSDKPDIVHVTFRSGPQQESLSTDLEERDLTQPRAEFQNAFRPVTPVTNMTVPVSGYAANTSRTLVQLPLEHRKRPRHDGFSAEDDALIVRLREVEGLSWRDIAKTYQKKGYAAVQKRYSAFLAPQKRKTSPTPKYDFVQGSLEDRILAVDPTLSGDPTQTRFGTDEDDTIKRSRETEGLNWDQIAARLPGRSPHLVRVRYQFKFLPEAFKREQSVFIKKEAEAFTPSASRQATPCQSQIESHDKIADDCTPSKRPSPVLEAGLVTLDQMSPGMMTSTPGPGAKSSPGAGKWFTRDEDDVILQLKETRKFSWDEIAMVLSGRTAKAISLRYLRIVSARKDQPEKELAMDFTPPPQLESPSIRLPRSRPQSRRARDQHCRHISLPAALPSVSQTNDNTLLKKALGNSLRHRSDQHVRAPLPPTGPHRVSRMIGVADPRLPSPTDSRDGLVHESENNHLKVTPGGGDDDVVQSASSPSRLPCSNITVKNEQPSPDVDRSSQISSSIVASSPTADTQEDSLRSQRPQNSREKPVPSSSSSRSFVKPTNPANTFGKPAMTAKSASLRVAHLKMGRPVSRFRSPMRTGLLADSVVRKRVVETPAREMDSDEDELA